MATPRMATVEVYNGLYQRANFLSWTYDQKQKLLNDNGITVVVNLWNKVDPDLSGKCMYICWPIRGNAMPEQRILVLTVAALIKRGEHVLVHCEAGVNRSVWFCAEVVAQVSGWELKEALTYVKERLPRAKVHRALSGEENGDE